MSEIDHYNNGLMGAFEKLGVALLLSRETTPDQPAIIDLSGQNPLFKGSKRKVFAVPGRPEFVVKVFRYSQTPIKQKRQSPMRKFPWFRNSIIFDQNQYDLRELNRLYDRCGEELWLYFPKTSGIVETSMGSGLLQARILNADGTPAKDLTRYLETGDRLELVLACLAHFKQYLRNHHIVVRDLYSDNILVQELEEGRIRMVMIDGFGNSDFIKIASYSRAWNDKKLDRKFDALIAHLKSQAAGLASS